MKKGMASFFTLLLILSMAVVGCNKKVEPQSAADLLKINEDIEKNNFSLDGGITMNMGMEAMGLTIDIPIDMQMQMDVVEENAHGNVSIVMEMGALGGENKINNELYVEKEEEEITVYTKSDGNTKWSKAGSDSQDSEKIANMVMDLLKDANFDSSDFKHDEEAKTYVVTQKFSDMIADGDMEEVFTTLFGSLGALGIDEENVKEIMEGMGKSEVIYTFDDEECHLQSMKMENMDYIFTTKIGGMEMNIKVSLGMDYNYSNYGQIKAEDVTVPEDVKAEAE